MTDKPDPRLAAWQRHARKYINADMCRRLTRYGMHPLATDLWRLIGGEQ